MEPTQALNFNIPKLKRQVTKDNLFEIDSNSRDAKELLDSVGRTYLDQNYSGPWKVRIIDMVRNTELEQEYKAKRTDMKEEGRHNRELTDQLAFCAIKEQSYITKIAKNGMMTDNLPLSIIGEHKSGVYLTKHADVQFKMVETISSQTITALFVFKTVLGKCKTINERVMSSPEPTPNFDCHIPLQPAQPSDVHIVQLQRSQIYFYEYDNDGMPVSRPRQCLPYAVITYEKIDNFTMGPLKSIYCYDPMKSSSQAKKGEDKPDWKKTPRNMGNPQLPFQKNSPLDNQIRSLPFAPPGWASNLISGGPPRDIIGGMNEANFAPDSPQDVESVPNQGSILNPSLLFNYAQQIAGAEGQGVVVHRSGSDPRRRFQQKPGCWYADETPVASEQQRNLPSQQMQTFQNFQPGYQGGFDYQFPKADQNFEGSSGWEPKAPHGFYSECEPSDNSNQLWYQSSNNNFNNNNSNKSGHSGWNSSGSNSFETDDHKKTKLVNANCDNKSTNNTNDKPSGSSGSTIKKKTIPFALNKKKSTPTAGTTATSQQKTQANSSHNEKSNDSSSFESDKKNMCYNNETTNSTEKDSKQNSQGKAKESVANKIPFPKKSSAPKVSDELPKAQNDPQDSHIEDLLNKLYQAECKDNISTSSFGGKSSEKGKSAKVSTQAKGMAAGQLPEKVFSVHDVSESDLKKLHEYIKEKMKSTKENDEKIASNRISTDNPKIKTTLSSLKQGLKTTILLPNGSKNEENVLQLEDLTKLLNIVDIAINLKAQPSEVIPAKWENNYQSFLKTVQKMELVPGQHHKWVRKKELPPEPPLLEKIPPPMTEVSIDDVVNTKLMKEFLMEQEFSESTSVSEADSLYLPPTERKKRKTSSPTTRRQAKKKMPFDMTSYRRRRKRQKMQRKAAAVGAVEFDNSSLASTTSSFGFGDSSYHLWESDFKEIEREASLDNDLLLYNKEVPYQEPTLKNLGFDSWKDAILSLKFQPVVALKDCVQQITSHLHQEGSSNIMEWVGSQKELIETLNLPPDHTPVNLSDSIVSKSSSSQNKTNVKVSTTTASKIGLKPKISKNNAMDSQSLNDTISINSIKASVKSEINKIKKVPKKNVLNSTDKKKLPKPTLIEIPSIKAKLPEKSLSSPTKLDTSLQNSTNIYKDVKKPTTALTTSGLLTQTSLSKSTLNNSNKILPPKGIIKTTRTELTTSKASTVSPATFPPTDQSLKVDLLMNSISAPSAAATPSEAEQKKLAELKKTAEQKKQKISFQTYMEKHVRPKPAKSPPHEKTNVFETFKDFLSPEPDSGLKPIPKPLVTTPSLTTTPILETLKPALVMPPSAGVLTNSLFSPLSPPPQISRDPRIPLKLPLPFSKDHPLPKIIPTIPKPVKEALKPILKDKPQKSSSISHRKAPLPKTIPTSITIPLDEPREPSEAPVDPRLSRKPPPSLPDFHPVKEAIPNLSTLIEPLLPRDPRLFKIYGEYQSDGVIGNKLSKAPSQDGGSSSVKLKPDPSEGVSDIIGKGKPLIKKDTWNLCAIQTGDDKPIPSRKRLTANEVGSLHQSLSKKKPGEDIPVYAQFSKDISKGGKPSKLPLNSKNEETAESHEVKVDEKSWGFYREMSPKRAGSEDTGLSSEKDQQLSLLQQKSDENTSSDMDIVSESPQALCFSDSDSNSNLIGEDLTKPLYIDENASATPRRDPFENYKFTLKSSKSGLKKLSGSAMDPRKSTAMDLHEKTEGFKNPLVSSESAITKNMPTNFRINLDNNLPEDAENMNLSPFNETVPPADSESKNSSGSSLFCAYQMEGQAELKDTSHIWMKSLSTLSQAKAVSTLNISDDILDVLRKVVKENIPAGQKDLPQSTTSKTLNSTKETSMKIPKKPDTLDKDYKLGILDKNLFSSNDLEEEFFESENANKQGSSKWSNVSDGITRGKRMRKSRFSDSSVRNAEVSATNSPKLLDEMYNPSDPTGDKITTKSEEPTAQTEEFVPGKAIPVLSGNKKQGSFHKGSKKSRSLSPTTTIPSTTPYLPSATGWITSQPPPFWSALNQKYDGIWQNLPPFPSIITSLPSQQIWPPPLNVPPNSLGNIPFPLGYIPPDLPMFKSNPADPLKPPNLFDWFADKINPKGEPNNNENNMGKTNTDPCVSSATNCFPLSQNSISGIYSPSLVPSRTQSSISSTLYTSADTKTLQSKENVQISNSRSFTELSSINTNQENSNSRVDSEKSRSSSYSPTDKTSEIVSISASDPSMSPRTLDSVKPTEKEALFKHEKTISIDSSLSSENSKFSKMDSGKKSQNKQLKSNLTSFSTAFPSSNVSEDGVWHQTEHVSNETKKSNPDSSKVEPNMSIPVGDSTSGQHDADTSFSKHNDSVTNEEDKKKRSKSSEDQKKCKSRHQKDQKKSCHSSSNSKPTSSVSSKSFKDVKLTKYNQSFFKRLNKQILRHKRKSDLQNLLESIKKIKKELALQPSNEKGSSLEKFERKSLRSPSRSRHGSEEKSSSSRSKKYSEKDDKVSWSKKKWKPIKSLEEDFSSASGSSSTNNKSTKSSSSSSNKHNTKKQDVEPSTSKVSINTTQDVSKKAADHKQPEDEKNSDLELEEGELPDKESESSEEETVTEEYPKRRSSRQRSESSHRKRRQSDRKYSSHEERPRKKHTRHSKPEDDKSSKGDNHPYERVDTYSHGSPDRYIHDRMENYQYSRMDCYPMDTPEEYPENRMDPYDNFEDCPPERSEFYPPNRNGKPDNFVRGKQKRFHGKRKRSNRGKFKPFPHNKPGGHYREESNNYPDDNFNDYGPEGHRYPRGRSENYPYEKSDYYMHEPSHDPNDYLQDESDGFLYEKSNEQLPFPKGYSHNWPDRHNHGRRGGSYSPGREENYPDDSLFLGRGSPPRDGGPLRQGRYPSNDWSISYLREIKIEVKNSEMGNGGQKRIGQSVLSENLAVESFPVTENDKEAGPVSYRDTNKQTGPNQQSGIHGEEEEDEEKTIRDTFDTIDNYLQMFVKEGSREYKILKKSLGVPLETRFDSLSKTKRKKIRKKIQSQLQALKQAPGIGNNEEKPSDPFCTFVQTPERSAFKIEDFQNFSAFKGNPNSMECLKNWLNQRPEEDKFLRSRSLSETRDDSEDDGNIPDFDPDIAEDMAIADPEVRRSVKAVCLMEKSPGFGIPHQKVPLKLLLAEEKDNMFSFEGCFLILMRKISRKAVERLMTLREVLNFLTGELQAAQKSNDILKFRKLQETKNKLHDRRKAVLEKFTGIINPGRLQAIRDVKKNFEIVLEYIKRKPDPMPKVDKEFVVKSIKAIQGHVNMAKKFLDEQISSTNNATPMSSFGFGPDRSGPNQMPDPSWSWYGGRNMDVSMPGCYNQPWNNVPPF